MMRHKVAIVAVVAVVALATGGWFLQRETEPEGSVYQQARLFDDVLAHVSDYYVDSLDERKLYEMAIDGRSTEGWKQDQAVKELRGPAGTPAELTIRRSGVDQPITYKLTRAAIHIRSVQIAMMLDDRVGYVSLSPVNETSAQEVALAVDSLMKQGMK